MIRTTLITMVAIFTVGNLSAPCQEEPGQPNKRVILKAVTETMELEGLGDQEMQELEGELKIQLENMEDALGKDGFMMYSSFGGSDGLAFDELGAGCENVSIQRAWKRAEK